MDTMMRVSNFLRDVMSQQDSLLCIKGAKTEKPEVCFTTARFLKGEGLLCMYPCGRGNGIIYDTLWRCAGC